MRIFYKFSRLLFTWNLRLAKLSQCFNKPRIIFGV